MQASALVGRGWSQPGCMAVSVSVTTIPACAFAFAFREPVLLFPASSLRLRFC